MRRKALYLVVVWLLGLTSLPANEPALDGRLVVLTVGEHRDSDPYLREIEAELLHLRKTFGLTSKEMPLVFMGFADSDAERKFFERLGFRAQQSPVVCVAEWGSPARFGPKRVLGQAIVRRADVREKRQEIYAVVADWLRRNGHQEKLSLLPEGVRERSGPGELSVESVHFEANGKPLYLVNFRVRVRNQGGSAVEDVGFEFFCRRDEGGEWVNLGEHRVSRIPGGYVISRDLVADSRKVGILDAQEHVGPCFYRVTVSYGQHRLQEEGLFTPKELGEQ